ncbi:MAG TPA: potassium channel family protein [Ktedonobacteraceae bacterium]|nr:potassium channel family protein [Ktedonobacteraceae bacterium]
MSILVGILGLLLILIVLQDAFESIVLPRRVARRVRFARLFYTTLWGLWSMIARKMRSATRREFFLSIFGPLSLLVLLVCWGIILVFAFALIQWAIRPNINVPENSVNLGTYLYLSGVTFFTLGYGDIVPITGLARTLAVVETGIGFGFLALVIGYVPVIYQAFSRRESEITLLDARAGSPPSAIELLRRYALHRQDNNVEELLYYLRNWEHWCSDILESHLSYSVLMYYRSQHDRVSWLAALTAMLDLCAILMTGLDSVPDHAARFTFAMARHAAVDLAQVFGTTPDTLTSSRLSSEDFQLLKHNLAEFGLNFRDGEAAETKLASLRRMYEPYVDALSTHLLMPLPAWVPRDQVLDDWQTSIWDHFSLTSQRPLNKAR